MSKINIYIFPKDKFLQKLSSLPKSQKDWLTSIGYNEKSTGVKAIPDNKGKITAYAYICENPSSMWAIASLASSIESGDYQIHEDEFFTLQAEHYLGFLLEKYRYDKFKQIDKKDVRIEVPKQFEKMKEVAKAHYLARDMINCPPNLMTPQAIADQANEIAREYDAKINIISGEDLIKHDYPAIHAVGKGSANAPTLIDISWGKKNAKKLTLIGKGVCFDTGGLDIKSSSNMRMMKKDMGGAAITLALASLIMAHNLPVRLRLMIPAVENSISGNSYRPSDVITGRSGKTIEIGNTDAEGRVIMSDCLSEAASENPDLIIDCATLTGAARVALGTEIPAFFTRNDEIANALAFSSSKCQDPMWRLPLWDDYRPLIKSNIADISNDASTGFGGAITAALFLDSFVEPKVDWLHLDMMAWNSTAKAGRPEGGEAQGLRALFDMLCQRYK